MADSEKPPVRDLAFNPLAPAYHLRALSDGEFAEEQVT
jgi:hypothetical protein